MDNKPKVAFYTLGCKLNFSETSTIARTFTDAGYQKVDFDEPADIYVINTCSVTEIADKKCRYVIHKAIKNNPQAKIVVTGCFAQLKPGQISAIDGVDIVLSNNEKHRILEYIDKEFKGGVACDYRNMLNFYPAWSYDDRTRSFLKIQDGCDYFCSYCTIPQARGLSRSDSIKNVINKAQSIVKQGVKEIVLTGVNIGDFGRKNGETFYELLCALQSVKGLERLRLSSVEPNLLDNSIIEMVAKSDLIMPHFHIPLQCGVDRLLKSMKRRYTTQLFRNKVDTIRALIPDAYIAIDIIVGVPGETDKEFQETIKFIESLQLSELHIFTYSERPNTEALKLEQVPKAIRRQRSAKLHAIAKQINYNFCKHFETQARPVLLEKSKSDNIMEGFTDNYLKVVVPYKSELINQIIQVKLSEYHSDKEYFCGEVLY